jgi:uncharacterized protein
MAFSPTILPGRQVIESYGTAGFRVSGTLYTNSVIVFPDRSEAWPVGALDEVTEASLAPVMAHGEVEILLLGCGRRQAAVPHALMRALRSCGIGLEPMDTGAACRTYNVLLAEERRVAAALILPV